MIGLVFTNNSAQYGDDIASYAIKVIRYNSNNDQVVLSDVGSGIKHEDIVFRLVDHDLNVFVLDGTSQISITPTSSNQLVLGTGVKKVTAGVATFDDLILISQPGDQNIEFKISSKAIDSEKLMLQYGMSTLQNPIDASFRLCKPGEIQRNGQ